ncbi:uncharacterized protein L199_006411 [Kwoniella botswanensis]|uniref:uncharacterized protein n=1 Tax=Kwoniella botswanensis TaxID=1268659 RepID=UPI00315DFF22
MDHRPHENTESHSNIPIPTNYPEQSGSGSGSICVPPPPPPRQASGAGSEHYPPLYTRVPVDFQLGRDHVQPNDAGPSTYPHQLDSSYLSHPQQLPMVYSANPPQLPTNPHQHIYHRTPPVNKRRRGRLATACVNCNRRKQRCDGEIPCGLCVKRNVPCSYPTEMNTSYNADAERVKQSATMVASGFNSATILGILCHLGYKDSRFPKGSLRSMIQAYIALEEKTIRRDEALETELMVLRMMEAKALAREDMDLRSGRTTPGSHGSVVGNEAKLMVQIKQSRFMPPPPQIPMVDNQSRPPSSGSRQHRLQHQQSRVDIATDSSVDINASNEIWSSSAPVHVESMVNSARDRPQPGTGHGIHSENENDTQQPYDLNSQYDPTNVPLPTPLPHSSSTPSLSTALGLPNYNHNHTYNDNPDRNTQGVDIRTTPNDNEWYLPSDWDPTTSGLPDSSDPSAWQALMGMEWMNNLDLDMGLDMTEGENTGSLIARLGEGQGQNGQDRDGHGL